MTRYCFFFLVVSLAAPPVFAYTPAKPIPDGWVAVAQLGALITTGATRTTSINTSLKLSHKIDQWENKLRTSFLRSSTRLLKDRKDSEGNVILDSNGQPEQEIVKGKSSNRFYIEYQPQWYFTKRSYIFSKLNWETDKPANIDNSSRQIAGVGHTFWRNRTDVFGAEIGLGNKRFRPVTGETTHGGIGYFGLKYVHRLSPRSKLGTELYSDFGGESSSTEFELSFGYSLTSRIATKFKYSGRFNDDALHPENPLDWDAQGEFTINLEIDIL